MSALRPRRTRRGSLEISVVDADDRGTRIHRKSDLIGVVNLDERIKIEACCLGHECHKLRTRQNSSDEQDRATRL